MDLDYDSAVSRLSDLESELESLISQIEELESSKSEIISEISDLENYIDWLEEDSCYIHSTPDLFDYGNC